MTIRCGLCKQVFTQYVAEHICQATDFQIEKLTDRLDELAKPWTGKLMVLAWADAWGYE